MCNKGYGLGYSLIEVMVVVAILGMLMAVTIPSYNGYVRESRRVDAQQYLMQQTMMLERNFTRLGRYPVTSDFVLESDSYYTYTYAPGGATTYTLRAVPTGSQAKDECGTMTIDQKGRLTATLSSCWK